MQIDHVDIIVIGRNEAHFLSRCLESVREASDRLLQECHVQCEVVYIDSHSSDNSVAIAESAGVRVLYAPRAFRSPANGRMAGVLQTHGGYIMFLDGDMELHPAFLAEAMMFMQEHPNAAGVRGIWDDLQYRGAKPVLIKNIDKVPGTVTSKNAYFAGAFFARRKMIEQVGGYEVGLLINEELALYCKLRYAGWKTYQIPVPMITHFNSKISSPRSIIFHILIGRKPFMAGVLLRHSVLYTHWWPQLLHYHLPKLFHGAFLLIVGVAAVMAYHLDKWRFSIGLAILLITTTYSLIIIWEKSGISRGLAAIVLRTFYILNLFIGFFLYFPKMHYGFQATDAYREMVLKENRKISK